MSRFVTRRALGALLAITAAGTATPACLSRPIETIEPRTTSTYVEDYPQNGVDKIDILLTIDDSLSMADKQRILSDAVPQLVESLVNPLCVPFEAGSGEAVRPENPTVECPEGTHREFDPVHDIHVGIIKTGVNVGMQDPTSCTGSTRLFTVDGATTYGEGVDFLAWDPNQKLSPPGQSDSGTFMSDLGDMVEGVGQEGCGYEAPLESWYRFLVQPDPPKSFVEGAKDSGYATMEPSGIDTDLLAQRAAFLRPDSLVAIIMLSDENDCSLRAPMGALARKKEWFSQQIPRSVCKTDPTSECCARCSDDVPNHCGADKVCEEIKTNNEADLTNLACHDMKRRFGIDLLHPTQRYIDGLTSYQIANENGELVDNPLLVAADGTPRSKDRVFLTGIVGVPWQSIARDSADLGKGFMSHSELTANGSWAQILGSPSKGVAPTDPHMQESYKQRSGLPTDAGHWDEIHGHEHNVGNVGVGRLQYACTFALPQDAQFDCEDKANCDCTGAPNDPLCLDDSGNYTTVQRRAKAHPGLRQLEVLQGIEDQGVVASICPKQVDAPTKADYGYQPAIGALVDRLKEQLRDPCLPRSLTPNVDGNVACLVLEGRRSVDGTCDCNGAARQPVSAAHQPAVNEAMKKSIAIDAELDCFCEIPQLADEQLSACQNDANDDVVANGAPVDGWCYIDATSSPMVGNPELVEQCALTERRTIRLVGKGQATQGATVFLTCQAE